MLIYTKFLFDFKNKLNAFIHTYIHTYINQFNYYRHIFQIHTTLYQICQNQSTSAFIHN